MSSLVIQNSICVLPVVFGAAAVKKGYEDFKNEHRVYGIAKMTFGTLLAGAGIGFAIYNFSSQETEDLSLKSCYSHTPYDEMHPSCPSIFAKVHDVLKNGELMVLGTRNPIAKLTGRMYEKNIDCQVHYNTELDCHVKLTAAGVKTLNGSPSGTWVSPDHKSTNSFFKEIQGCELIERLQVHLGTK